MEEIALFGDGPGGRVLPDLLIHGVVGRTGCIGGRKGLDIGSAGVWL